MKRWTWILIGFMFPIRAHAVTDPLSSQFFPSINENASTYPSSITITNSLYKVYQSSPTQGTTHWWVDNQMANEIRSFQVHVNAGYAIPALNVTMSNLTNAQTGTVIYSTSTDIIVYREWYMNIATPTCLSTTTYMGGTRAYMPDPLIPAVDPYYHQTTNAFPVAVTAGNTQSTWIDVHIPTAAPSGYYQGVVTVSSTSVVLSTMPVVIGVWAWVMPSTAALSMIGSGFGYNGMCDISYGGTTNCGNYPNSGGGADGANTMQWIDGTVQMLDNRYTIDSPSNIYPETGSFSEFISSIGPLLNGTQANTTTILPGAALTTYDLNHITFTSGEWQNFATNFTNQGWYSRLFNYLVDEPSGSTEWAEVVSSGMATRGFSTPLIPNQATADIADALTYGATNYLDWLTPIIENIDTTGSGNLRSTYNTWLSTNTYGLTRKVGSYNDCESAGTCSNGTIGPSTTPGYPNRHIDGTPVANRAMETWEFLNNMNYELYFAVDICDTPSGGCACTNPWQCVYDFGGNGDGTLMYPSTSTLVGITVSTPIWCPSIRLKEFRDGESDYAYENYLTQKGEGSFVNSQIASWMTNGYTFNNNPSGVEAARIAMGTAIHQLTYPPPVSAPVTLTGGVTINGGATLSP